jgi:hypothetical protein
MSKDGDRILQDTPEALEHVHDVLPFAVEEHA